MSEKEYCGIQDFSKYDEMTTEELQEILRLDAENTEGQESDVETLLYVTGVLAERRKKNGQTGNTAQEAYEIFEQHYMPEIDNKDSVPAKGDKLKTRSLRWMRSLVAAAAAVVILLSGVVTAEAYGVDVWKAVVQWTQDTFHFGSWGDSGSNNNLPYASLQEAMEKGNTPTWLVPTWIPDGYKLTEITVTQNPAKKIYRAKYTNEEHAFLITVRDHLGDDPVYVEQSDGLIEEYNVEGITFYLFENNNHVQVVWIVDSYECYIAGDITIDDLKTMVRSITKG